MENNRVSEKRREWSIEKRKRDRRKHKDHAAEGREKTNKNKNIIASDIAKHSLTKRKADEYQPSDAVA